MSREMGVLAARLTCGAESERAQAVRLHDFVRDRIEFGFTPQLAAATPHETLRAGVAHTLGKTRLFVALLRAVGLRASPHFVTIDREILRGVFPHGAYRLLPWEITHAYTEVEIDRRWLRLDSYAVDRPLWRAAVGRLVREGAVLGYGVHREGTCRWNGGDDAFAQLATPDMVVEDHGAHTTDWAAIPAHLDGAAASWSGLFAFANESVAAASARRVNDHLAALRNDAAPAACAVGH